MTRFRSWLWAVVAVPLLVAGCAQPPSGGSPDKGPVPAPRPSGSLSLGQAARAEVAVRMFLTGLSRNNTVQASRFLLPGQRSCLSVIEQVTKLKLTALRMLSVRPAGQGRASVLFEMTASVQTPGGLTLPYSQSPGELPLWLAVVQVNGAWYVDLRHSEHHNQLSLPLPCS